MTYRTFLLCAAAAAASSPAAAQDAPDERAPAAERDEIVVTARFREESVDDIGQTINLLTGEDLQKSGVLELDDIVRLTPGLDNLSRGPGRNRVLIRGVASLNGTGDIIQQAAPNTVFFDEISVNQTTGNQTDLPFYDIGRVEVLKGPQPTYFGEGSVGGSIRVFSEDPDLENFGGRTRKEIAGVQDGGLNYIADGSVNVPVVSGRAALRLTGFFESRDGFVDVVAPGGEVEDANTYQNAGFQGVFLYNITDNVTWRLSGFYQNQNVGDEQAVTDLDNLTSIIPLPDSRRDDSFLISNKISATFGDVTVESVTGYFDRQFLRNSFDLANTSAINSFGLPGEIETVTENSSNQFSQELRVITNFDGPLNVTGGLLYGSSSTLTDEEGIEQTGIQAAALQMAGLAPTDLFVRSQFEIDGEQFAVFGEVRLALFDERLRLSGGARYFDQSFDLPLEPPISEAPIFALLGLPTVGDSTSFGQEAFNFDLSEVLPRFQAEFDLQDNILLFASAAKGARNGLFNSPASLSLAGFTPGDATFQELITYQPDTAWSFEAGVKSQFLDDRLRLNLSGFYTDWDDIQTNIQFGAFSTVINGESARVVGFEGEVSYEVSDRLTVFASGAFQDAEFDEPLPLVLDNTGAPLIFAPEGTPLPQISRGSMFVGAEARQPAFVAGLDLVGRATYSFTGERLNGLEVNVAEPDAPQDNFLEPIDLVNLRLGLENETFSLSVFADNVTNEIVTTFDGGGVLNGEPIRQLFINRPRTIGVVLRSQF